jgi:hypothetical protein
MNRFEVVKPTEQVAPMGKVQQIEVTVVDRGLRRWRRTARATADTSKVHLESSFLSLEDRDKAITLRAQSFTVADDSPPKADPTAQPGSELFPVLGSRAESTAERRRPLEYH